MKEISAYAAKPTNPSPRRAEAKKSLIGMQSQNEADSVDQKIEKL